MFGIEALDVVIGLIFIYLLFSLFVSIINEIILKLLNSRSNELFKSIEELIGEDGIREIFNDPRIKVLTKTKSKITSAGSSLDELKKTWPDYIPESLFADIIAGLDNNKLKGAIETFSNDAKNSSSKMKEVFEVSLLKTRQTFIKRARQLTIIVSAFVVIAFNVDSITIFKDLANDPEKAAIVADMAERYIASHDTSSVDSVQKSITELKLKLADLNKAQIQDVESTLGFGWTLEKGETILDAIWNTILNFGETWQQIIGWFISVLALSLGAPFWFDLLKRVVNIKQELTNSEKTNGNKDS